MQLVLTSPGTFLTQKDECFRLKNEDKVMDISPLKVESIVITNQAMIIHERILWLHQQLKKQKLSQCSVSLAEKFEMSIHSGQRYIAYLRDRMQSPVQCDSSKKGYFYTEQDFELPLARASQEEILDILLARNILSGTAEGLISRKIHEFSRKLMSCTAHFGLTRQK